MSSWLKKGFGGFKEQAESGVDKDQHIQHLPRPVPLQPTHDPLPPTPPNPLLFQSFEWHTPSTPPNPHETHSPTSHWSRLERLLPKLKSLGITSIWLPPGCKANSPGSNGYDCYDLWDLGEFDQKWARSTKWGSREELDELVQKCEELEIGVIWDAVLNHKTAGDKTEETWAVEVEERDRRVEKSEAKKIEAWIKYEFPGREREGMKYSKLKWGAEHFNGTDWDQKRQSNALYKLIDDPASYPKPLACTTENRSNSNGTIFSRLRRTSSSSSSYKKLISTRPRKGWALDVDNEHGNNDYLMFSNIYYSHPDVRIDVLNWGKWMVKDVGVSGFRLDAAQHFSYGFQKDWVQSMKEASASKDKTRDMFVVGEVWHGEVERIMRWLDDVSPGKKTSGEVETGGVYAFDSPLLYSFSRVSEDVRLKSKNADLRTLLPGPSGPSSKKPSKHASLVSLRPRQAVTLVTNHDTQPGQTSFTPMDSELKSLWYAFILLRQEGLPTVFWGDIFGTKGDKGEGPSCQVPIDSTNPNGDKRSLLPSLIQLRQTHAYGAQIDYFDSMTCIGWTRGGTCDRPGCVVVMSIGPKLKWTQKSMRIGKPGEIWVDVLSEREGRPKVVVDGKGEGVWCVRGWRVAVYVRDDEIDEIDEKTRSFEWECDVGM